MKADITFYGQLTDLTGTGKLIVENIASTNDLVDKLDRDFPGLKLKKFVIAVNDRIIKTDTPLEDNARISFLPPFSGG
jgi:molybdopterin converting factor small subunit